MKFYFPSYNGVCEFDNGVITASIVDRKGNKRVGSRTTKNKVIFWNIPLLRGLQYFVLGMVALFSSYTMAESLQNDDEENNFFTKLSSKLNIATKYLQFFTTIIISFLLGYLLLVFAPNALTNILLDEYADLYARGALIGSFRVVVIYLAFLVLRFLPSMQGLYKFNGVCNACINNQEKMTDFSKKNHHFALNYLNFFVFALLLATFMVSLLTISASFFLNILYNFLIMLGAIMVSYELLWLVTKIKSRWVKDFVYITSPLVSIKPSLTQEEIMRTILIEKQYFKKDNLTLEENEVAMSALMSEMQTKLMPQDRYEKSDVEWIIATILNKNRAEIKLIRSVSKKDAREILRATDRRAKGEPLSSIFGFVDFYGLKIEVNKKVLSPRMETELLVEEALKVAKTIKKPTICDLCTGSGAIAIAIAKNIDAKIYALDISKPALALAEQNAKTHEVKIDFIQSDLFDGLKKNKRFDIIVSNPPYIPTKEIEKLSVEVKKYDPKLALDGGEDGLDFYRRIIETSGQRLNKGGTLMFELGIGQAKAVRKLFLDNGFIDTKVVKDYNGIERIIYGRLSK